MERSEAEAVPPDPRVASPKLALAASLLAFLEARGVRYVAVGDLSSLVRETGGDLDLVFDSLHGATELLLEFCRACRARPVQVLQHEQTAFYYVLARSSGSGQIHFLHPDVCSDYFRRGRLLLRAEEMLAGRRRVRTEEGLEVWVPRPAMNFTYYLIKKIDKEEITAQQRAYLGRLWHEDPEGSASEIRRYWPGPEGDRLSDAAARGDWSAILGDLPRLRKALGERIHRSPRHWLLEQIRRARRVLRPTGLTVAFLGPDGAGKSSVVDGVARAIAPAFRHTRVHHLRVGLFLRRSHAADASDPHGRPSRGTLGSCLQLCAWWIEYTLAFLIEILPSTIRSTLVLFDRHAMDVLVDPKRYRYGGPGWFARWVVRSIPRPDLVILLDVEPELLRQRKLELSLPEIERQRDAYRHLVADDRWGHLVDARPPLSDVVGAASDIVLTHMAARTARRRASQP